MRCRASLERECERLELALKAVREELAAAAGQVNERFRVVLHRSVIKIQLDEAHLRGQIQAIKTMLEPEPGGWPHDAWFGYVDARRDAVLSLVKAGRSFEDILETLNLTEIQARLIIKVEEPDNNKN